MRLREPFFERLRDNGHARMNVQFAADVSDKMVDGVLAQNELPDNPRPDVSLDRKPGSSFFRAVS